MRTVRQAFTLVELLVVIGIIAVLIGVLLPTLGKARRQANAAKCLANMRSMQVAQWNYIVENKGWLVQAGFGHGGSHVDEDVAWFNTLQRYYQDKLVARCPSDDSVHWETPLPGTPPQLRRTSYGINNFLNPQTQPWGANFVQPIPPSQYYLKIDRIRRPAATIQFVEMAYTGEYAAADHPHIEGWASSNPCVQAGKELEINAHGNRPKSWESVANYGFLDGHAETLRFRDVFESFNKNKFDPAIAR